MAYKDTEKAKATRQAYLEANKDKIREQHRAYDKAYYLANAEKKKAAAREWHHSHKDQAKDKQLRRKYGLSLDAYIAMYAAANGCCQICGKHAEELHVDHDHIADKVRGLLCESCNRGLGFFWDDPALLRQAIDYLDKTKQV